MRDWRDKRVGVVMGGRGSERSVSLRTGAAFVSALEKLGVDVEAIDLVPENVAAFVRDPPAVVLNALHGRDGEDGTLQGMLELLGVPYTGSGVAASALAIDKVRSKCVFDRFGVPTPAWSIARSPRLEDTEVGLPCVVKPALEGSSVGVAIVRTEAEWDAAYAAASTHRGEVLVEAYVAGRELTVGIFDDAVMGIIEIETDEVFYDFEAKYQRNDTRYSTPELSDTTRAAVEAAARAAYDALGCRGVARADVMLDADERPLVLEVNTVPGMTETSLVPKLAAAAGTPFEAFVSSMLDAATTDAEALS